MHDAILLWRDRADLIILSLVAINKMFGRTTNRVPWNDIGTQLGKRLLQEVDPLSSKLATILEAANDTKQISTINSNHWRYEFAIWYMFWLWYVANSPRLAKQNAGSALLDSYYRSGYDSIARAGLLPYDQTDFSSWKLNLEQRFHRYKRAFEYRTPYPRVFSGTVGDEFSRDVFQDEGPHPKFAIVMNEQGTVRFQSLAKMVDELEDQYSK